MRVFLYGLICVLCGVAAFAAYFEHWNVKNLHPHPPDPISWFQCWVRSQKAYAKVPVDSYIAKEINRWISEHQSDWKYTNEPNDPRDEFILTDTYSVELSDKVIRLDYMWSRKDFPEYPITVMRSLTADDAKFWNSAVERMTVEAISPNQSTDPTLSSGAPAAGQPARHP